MSNANRAEFLRVVTDLAARHPDALNVAGASGHAAVESRFGTSGLATAARNLFGIKAGSSWDGDTVMMPTREWIEGEWVVTNAWFRAYDSLADSVADYAAVVSRLYPGAVRGRCAASGFLAGLFLTGPLRWATDPGAYRSAVHVVDQYALEGQPLTAGGSWRVRTVVDSRPLLWRVVSAVRGRADGALRVTGPRALQSGEGLKFDIDSEA